MKNLSMKSLNMKPWIARIVFLLATLVPAFANTPFVFVYEVREVFPYYMGETQIRKNNPGATVEMVKALENYLPIDVRFIRLPWKRALIALKTGRADSLVASFKDARKVHGLYPVKNNLPDPERSLDLANYSLYAIRGTPISWDPSTLQLTGSTRPIGAPAGYSVVALLKKNKVNVDEYRDAWDNLIKLVSGRLSGAALLEFDTDRILFQEQQRFKDIIKIKPPLISKYYYLMISHRFYKKYPHLSVKIWDACGRIRKSSRDKIMQKYLHLAE